MEVHGATLTHASEGRPGARPCDYPRAIAGRADSTSEREAPDELLADLVRELAVLVRRDLELAGARRGPQIRGLTIDLVAVLAAAWALFIAFGTLTWVVLRALTPTLPGWAAGLVVAGAWALVAALVLRHRHPRRLRALLGRESQEEVIASAERDRAEAEQAVRVAAGRLSRAVSHEAEAREREAAAAVAKHLGRAVERELEAVLRELLSRLTTPGKDFLEKLTGRESGERTREKS